ncbi:MAG TPA: DUF177 domain-containing protein [Oscillospiraceae bacterium]|nr:DUF177 domain-containing protein [Oscillospiraceae bacterium]HPF56379.1 DUF177 domain-containing protein [Clostridiales bacterium]HPK34322.1 DUF177 domain-containing protein [Oscillospiraceae bacterium]HPR75101.1 DUF177 domain-containing protein [Oscillospiraceae bacterium]
MFIDISDLIDNPGAKVKREGICDFIEWQSEISPIVNHPVTVKATACNDSGDIMLELSVDFILTLECDRCTEEFEQAHSEIFSHKLFDSESELGDIIKPDANGRLELNPIVWDDMMFCVPQRRLCKENCKGLCINCGGNLNNGSCGCDNPKPVLFEDEDISGD